jgi:cobalt/nickel transport system ATP-binding protein
MIELRDVTYSYGEICALKNVSLNIGKGESVALMGTNGCGKSTLLRIINGILFAQKGEYRFDETAVTEKFLSDKSSAKRFHSRVGFVFQNADVQLFCATVYDEVAFGPRQMGLPENETASRVEDCLSLLGIENLAQRQPYHLSGGEKKKTAIASVLSLNPDVLTLDEPLSGLDPRMQRWFVELIVKLNKSGKTVITSTHNLDLVHELSQRAVLFDESHGIAADMPVQKLLEDAALLRRVNLVDEFYHRHDGANHTHFHSHP